MKIAEIEGATRIIGEAQGYHGLPLRDVVIHCTVNGPETPAMETAWLPTPDELDRLRAGAGVILRILGTVHPPVMIEVGPAAAEPPSCRPSWDAIARLVYAFAPNVYEAGDSEEQRYVGFEEMRESYPATAEALDEAVFAIQALHDPVLSCFMSEAAPAVSWCQPNFNGVTQPRRFLVRYDDAEVPDAHFTDEREARAHFRKANVTWNCYLYGLLPALTRDDDPRPSVRSALPARDAEPRRERNEARSEGGRAAMFAALKEAERFMAYFAGETDGEFVGGGSPKSCLAQIRAALGPEAR